MRPALLLVFLLCCVPVVNTCLTCDRKYKELLKQRQKEAEQKGFGQRMKDARGHSEQRMKDVSKNVLVDRITMYRMSAEYVNEYHRILENPNDKGKFMKNTINMVNRAVEIIREHASTFQKAGACPNNCGLLHMRLLDCSSCQRIRVECRHKDCGDHTMQVMEGGQAVLDCFLPWHSHVLGKPEYFYSWSPGEPGSKKLKDSDFRGLLVTKESFFVLNEVLVEEQGTYRCSLQDKKGTVFSRITFRLTVTNDTTKTPPRRVTLPILPDGDRPPAHRPTGNQWEQVIITVTAVSLAASVGFMVALGIVIRRKGEVPTAG